MRRNKEDFKELNVIIIPFISAKASDRRDHLHQNTRGEELRHQTDCGEQPTCKYSAVQHQDDEPAQTVVILLTLLELSSVRHTWAWLSVCRDRLLEDTTSGTCDTPSVHVSSCSTAERQQSQEKTERSCLDNTPLRTTGTQSGGLPVFTASDNDAVAQLNSFSSFCATFCLNRVALSLLTAVCPLCCQTLSPSFCLTL